MPPKTDRHPLRSRGDSDFVNHTMSIRVPGIMLTVSDLNPDYPDSIHADIRRLHEMMVNDEPVPMLEDSAIDTAHWHAAAAKQRQRFETLTWQNSEWFFAETFAYRHLIQAVRWFENGRDPFLPKKRTEIDGEKLWQLLDTALQVEGSPTEQLHQVLAYPLWGNRIDLSHDVSLGHGAADTAVDDDLLADDRQAVIAQVLQDGQRVHGACHLIADNAGTELAMDLVLIDWLLQNGAETVTLHLKLHPTFVSDAIPDDVWQTLAAMREQGSRASALANRLHTAWIEKRLILVPHSFWNSSHFLWEMPPALVEHFKHSTLVVVKGDANYRRTIGDIVWDVDTAFSTVVDYFPAPLLALRTLKSDGVIGVAKHQADVIQQADPEWRTNGKRGVIQLALPQP